MARIANYPEANDNDTSVVDGELNKYYEQHTTFQGAQVYIQPNASGGVFIPAGSQKETDAQDTDHPSSFMSVEEYPRAVLYGRKAGNDHFMRYYKKKGTFVGALMYIETATDHFQ